MTARVDASRAHEVTLPLRTKGPNGGHEHWRTVHRRRKAERADACLVVRPIARRVGLPTVVRLVRLSAGELDDDNLRGALKGIRDGVADAFEVADNDPGLRWEYGQERAPRGVFGVRIEVTGGPA
ncbi:MAG: hypothetical protein IAE88_11580 [Rhodobacteraceae bacterium]|nr:hypothetical protein [Paracoccaceae bacterium]